MKYNFKKTLIVISILSFILSICGNTFAHSGRTDSSGGHRDNQNKSGLGNYHYHCGGYPAHLHDNGICPYSYSPVTATTTEETEPIIEATGIKINQNITSMKVGETNELTATITPDNAEDKSITWKTTNEDIATISTNGKIVALKEGMVDIIVSTSNGKIDKLTISVEEEKEVEEVVAISTSIQEDEVTDASNDTTDDSDAITGILGLGLLGGGAYLGYKKYNMNK